MNYKSSGVNIDAGNKAVELIKNKVRATHSPQVLNGLGSFAGFFELPPGYQEPVLVSCADGVGTKLKLAIESGIFYTVGVDLVAMCVNDLICCGAKPMYFLDYIACHKLIPNQIAEIIDGMTRTCITTDCSLIGGEMAEMNDLYQKGDFDLAGFCVGIVEKRKIIDGSKIKPGNFIYALSSSGLHSNGFSLVRKVMTDAKLKEHNLTKKNLLTPTKLYVKQVLGLILDYPITGIANITGGGLMENIERVLPKNIKLNIDKTKIKTPKIFKIIQKAGNISEAEMWRVFNMGVGMTVISETKIPESNDLYLIGKISS